MNLSFLPVDVALAVSALNLNQLTEIRVKSGQPVIIHYRGEYKYLKSSGISESPNGALVCQSAENILERAMCNSVYTYAEQLKYGFITVDGGVRIGIAAEYVTQDGSVISVRGVTSLNIRIPHEVIDCAKSIFEVISLGKLKSTLIFSPPGFGKTTVLRDMARLISTRLNLRVLIADERNEITGIANGMTAFNLGSTCDFVRGASKKFVFENAVRTMSPQVIVTDEIYGSHDYDALDFIARCGLIFIASSHICDRQTLSKINAEYFVELTGVGAKANIYDKNFNFICDCDTFCPARHGVGG